MVVSRMADSAALESEATAGSPLKSRGRVCEEIVRKIPELLGQKASDTERKKQRNGCVIQ